MRSSHVTSVVWFAVRLGAWLVYFCALYQSGLALTTWLVEPAEELNRLGVLMALLFPIMIASFPRVNRMFLRGSGKCNDGGCGL